MQIDSCLLCEFIFVPNRFALNYPKVVDQSLFSPFALSTLAKSFSRSLSSLRYNSTVSRVSFLVCVSCVLAAAASLDDDRRRVMRERERSMLLSTFFAHVRGKWALSFSVITASLADPRRLDGPTEKNDVDRSLLRRFLSDDTKIVGFY